MIIIEKIFVDTEFIETGQTIELLSIGLVTLDGREFYREPTWTDRSQGNAWVQAHVLPHLHPLECPDDGRECPLVTTPEALRQDLRQFCGYGPIFWGYLSAYDWVAICQVFGTMVTLPPGWPRYCRDLRQWLDHNGLSAVTQPEAAPHHALADAHWIRDIYLQYVESHYHITLDIEE